MHFSGKTDDTPLLTLPKRRPGTPESAKKSAAGSPQIQSAISQTESKSASTESSTPVNAQTSEGKKPASPEVGSRYTVLVFGRDDLLIVEVLIC